MNISKKLCEQQQLSVSKLSIISFVLSICSYILMVSIQIVNPLLETFMAAARLIIFFFLMTSFILSIIDLRKKHRKKVFSIIALILSSIYLLVIARLIMFLAAFKLYF